KAARLAAGGNHAAFKRKRISMAIVFENKFPAAAMEHASTDKVIQFADSPTQAASEKTCALAQTPDDSNTGAVAKLKLVQSSNPDSTIGSSNKGAGVATDQSA